LPHLLSPQIFVLYIEQKRIDRHKHRSCFRGFLIAILRKRRSFTNFRCTSPWKPKTRVWVVALRGIHTLLCEELNKEYRENCRHLKLDLSPSTRRNCTQKNKYKPYELSLARPNHTIAHDRYDPLHSSLPTPSQATRPWHSIFLNKVLILQINVPEIIYPQSSVTRFLYDRPSPLRRTSSPLVLA